MKKLFICTLLTLFAVTLSAQQRTTTTAKKQVKTTTAAKPKTTTTTKAAAKTTATPTMQRQPYTIQGTIEGIDDGEKVYLVSTEDRRQKRVDSATIRNGAFVFKGKTLPFPLSRFLISGKGYKTASADFFLEPGTIKAKLVASKRAEHITGTRHNNIYARYKDTSNMIVAQMLEQYTLMGQSSTPTDDKYKARLRVDSLKQCFTDYACDFTRRNTNNMVGVFLLGEYYKQFSLSDLKVILNRMNKPYGKLPLLETVQRYYNNAIKSDVGQPVVDLDILTLEGEPKKLKQLVGQGQPAILYLWTSSISAANSQILPLKRLQRRYEPQGLQIVSVSLDADTALIHKSLERTTPNWPQYMVASERKTATMQAYNLTDLPYIVLFDATGRIVFRGLQRDALENKIKELLPHKE